MKLKKDSNIQAIKQAIDFGAKMYAKLEESINSLSKQEREELAKYITLKKRDAIMIQDFEKAYNIRNIETVLIKINS
jgi:hypothetical protein